MFTSHTALTSTSVVAGSVRPLTSRISRRLVPLAATIAIVAAIANPGSGAAAITATNGAKVQCIPGTVFAYAPTSKGILSSFPNNYIHVRSFLQHWDDSLSDWVDTPGGVSPWWTYALTLQNGGPNGYGLAWAAYYSPWINASTKNLFNAFYPRYTFNVTPGYYYRVWTQVLDQADGTFVWILNRVNTGWGEEYCQA